MPDLNKFTKLREMGFRIPVTCQFCTHRNFASGTMWGQCKKNRYEHQKHDNPDGGRGVSIVLSGTCGDVELDPAMEASLGAHSEFLVP